MRVPRRLNILQTRWLLAVAATVSCAFILMQHGSVDRVDRIAAAFCGALLATLTYAPIQRIRISPERATTIGTISTFAGLVAVLVIFSGLSNLASPLRIVASFVGGGVLFSAIIISDGMRSIWRASL
jgi:hypothetical protein